MKTCDHSQQTLFGEKDLPLMSSAAGSPVRISHSLESELASKVRDLVSGQSTGELLASYDRASSSWRTSQACLLSGWEPFSETWPRSGMMLSGTAYRLPPSAPLTVEIASGSLPTPTAKANMMAPSMQKWAAHKNLWPTPAASVTNLSESPESWQARADKLKEKGINGNGAGVPLTVAVKMWPTPMRSDSRGSSGKPGPNKQVQLVDAVRLFPTPMSRDAHNRSGQAKRYLEQGRVNLQDRMAADGIRGSLNPTWVEWLMGFPLGWTVLELWATRSSRKSRK
jgi:hypothetical protein